MVDIALIAKDESASDGSDRYSKRTKNCTEWTVNRMRIRIAAWLMICATALTAQPLATQTAPKSAVDAKGRTHFEHDKRLDRLLSLPGGDPNVSFTFFINHSQKQDADRAREGGSGI